MPARREDADIGRVQVVEHLHVRHHVGVAGQEAVGRIGGFAAVGIHQADGGLAFTGHAQVHRQQADVAVTGATLAAYAFSLIGTGHVKVMASAFFAQKNTRAPMWGSGLALVTFTAACWALVGPLGVPGLGPRTFELAAGFLRIRDGEHPLDRTAVHPERYGVVEFDDNNAVLSLEEKPESLRSNYAVTGLYFLDGRAPQFARQIWMKRRPRRPNAGLKKPS